MCGFTSLNLTCIAAPPIRLVLSDRHRGIRMSIESVCFISACAVSTQRILDSEEMGFSNLPKRVQLFIIFLLHQ